ncbi:porin [Vibrio neonatus]|uniref:porin n=1 Tax=Vibrio neonatus TaxID=278860 RepID=UPI0021C3E919|nr:porin [Vibrio neonatus]
MKKTVLASVIAGIAFSGQAFAVELYNNGGTTFSLGGHVSVGLGNPDSNDDAYITDDDLVIESLSPRINFNATQDLGGGFTADAKGEWQLNMLEGGGESFKTRLGYIGVTHDMWGRVVGGTQWSPYYDVGGIADLPIAFANDFLYVDGGNLGTARAERMLSYRKGLDFDSFGLDFGLGWQGQNGNYGDRAQVTVSANFSKFMVGYGFTTGSKTGQNDDAMANLLSAKYGSYGDGLYVAGVYEMGSKFYGDFDTTNIEAIVAYALANSLNFSVNYESIEDDDNNETQLSQMALQVEYDFTPTFVGYAAYQIDLGDDISSDDDRYALGVRYYL